MEHAVLFKAFFILTVAASAATVSVDPVSIFIQDDATVDIDVLVRDVTDLFAYQFDIAFNPLVLSALSVSEGAFLSSGGATLFVGGVINSVAGTITFTANTLIGPVAGVTGTGNLATIQFSALSSGTSPISISNVLLLDSVGNDILTNLQQGSVTVVPEPSFAMLVAVVLGAGALRRKPRARTQIDVEG
jgi:hypothetical protein